MAPLDLPPTLKALHDSLLGEGDVPILDIYFKVANTTQERTLREAQQYIGTYVTKLNRKLRDHGQVVRPGRLKGTYCLTTL